MEPRTHPGAVQSTLPRHQLLDERGVVTQNPLLTPYTEDISVDDLKHLYRSMTMSRRIDEEGTSLQRQGQLVLWVPLRGQEAAQIGSAWPTRPTDRLYPSYREHAVAFERGVEPSELMRYFRGHTAGGWDPEKHNLNLYTVVLGSQAPHAVGYAMGTMMDRKAAEDAGTPLETDPEAVVAYFGDGASTEGEVHESMVFAASYDAPVLFFIQNNQWAISEPTTRQARVPLAARGPGFGVPSVRVDGNDVLATYAVTAEALERARTGGGPTLVEAFTYRMGAHTTSDDPTRYRSAAEEDYWRQRDPIDRLEKHLAATGELPEEFRTALAAEADALGERVRTFVRSLGRPATSTMFDHVYATPHAVVDAERAWFERYEASFAGGEHR